MPTGPGGIEVLPTSTASPGLPGLTGKPSPTTTQPPLVAGPVPAPRYAEGRLVEGYPEALRPAPGSRIDSSSLSGAGARVQVALLASTRATASRVLALYRRRLVALGFAEQETPAGTGAATTAFLRRQETVTLTTRGSTDYTVFATLRTR